MSYPQGPMSVRGICSKPTLLNSSSRVRIGGNLVSVLVLVLTNGVLYEVAEVEIGVSHDERRDPKWNGKPGYMSEDDLWEDLTGHGRETSLMIAEHQDN